MSTFEIERKFLVKSHHFKAESFKNESISQGFLSSVPKRTVRIRIIGNKAFITVKGIGNKSGITRFEWEKEISPKEAKDLLKICESGIITKTRYYVKNKKHIFEIDEFWGDNEGLVIAEIELTSENEKFNKPDWLGKEVTGEIKYYNSYLSKNPVKKW